MTADVPRVLILWGWFVVLLKHVCRLVSHAWTKRRLLQTCFTQGNLVAYFGDVQDFQSLVYDKKWAAAVGAITNLLSLPIALVSGWDKPDT